ncbi:hypothetical protein THASP1DRAFT_25822, partial [Thamnocephalis sphaerospora]
MAPHPSAGAAETTHVWAIPAFTAVLGVCLLCFALLIVAYLLRLLGGALEETFRPYCVLSTACIGWLWLAGALATLLLGDHAPAWAIYAGVCLLSATWMTVFAWRLCSLCVLVDGWRRLARKDLLWPWEADGRMELERYANCKLTLDSASVKRIGYLAVTASTLLVLISGTVSLSIEQRFYHQTFAQIVAANAISLYALDIGFGVALLACTAAAVWALQHLQRPSQMRTELIAVIGMFWLSLVLQVALRPLLGIYYVAWPVFGLAAFQLLCLGRPTARSPSEIPLDERPPASAAGWQQVMANARQWRAFAQHACQHGFRLHVEFVELYHVLTATTLAQFTENDRQRVFDASLRWGLLSFPPMSVVQPPCPPEYAVTPRSSGLATHERTLSAGQDSLIPSMNSRPSDA